MLAILSGVEFLKTVSKFRKRKRKSLPCVHVLHKKFNYAFSRRSHTVTTKKCIKKRDTRAKLVFCQSKPIAQFYTVLVDVTVVVA